MEEWRVVGQDSTKRTKRKDSDQQGQTKKQLNALVFGPRFRFVDVIASSIRSSCCQPPIIEARADFKPLADVGIGREMTADSLPAKNCRMSCGSLNAAGFSSSIRLTICLNVAGMGLGSLLSLSGDAWRRVV